MNESFPGRGVLASSVLLLWCLAITPGLAAEGIPALDPAAHEYEPEYRSDFAADMVDLSATLPWKERFTAEGAFDAAYGLQPSLQTVAAPPDMERSASSTHGYDAEGVVEEVRAGAGKLKIAHGPIERLGMPGMTMLFSVDDAAMLEGIEASDTIEFDVDSNAAGFVITRLRRTGGGQ